MNELELALDFSGAIMNQTTSKAFLEAVQSRAIDQWGKKGWIENLAREYVRIQQERGDKDSTYESRRRHVRRIFEEYNCNLDTALILATAVGCRVKLECTEIKVIEI